MVELIAKGEMKKVYNTQVSDLMIDTERNNSFCRLIKSILGKDIRVTHLEETKGKQKRAFIIIESE